MTNRKTVKDWANKHITFVYEADMTPLGYFECVNAVEYRAYRADGSFLEEFTSRRAAINAGY